VIKTNRTGCEHQTQQ